MAWRCIYYFSGVPLPGASNRLLCAGNTIRLLPIIWDKRRHLIILLDLFDLRSSPHRSQRPDRTPPFTSHPAPNGWRHTIDNQFDKERNLSNLWHKRRWVLCLNLAWLAELLLVALTPEGLHYTSIDVRFRSRPASFSFFLFLTQVPTTFLLSSLFFVLSS